MSEPRSVDNDAPSGNRRVDKILGVARKYGYVVTASEHVENCWTIRPQRDLGYSITVYGGPNHTASVMADLPGSKDWEPITQRHATSLLADGGLS